MNIPTPCLILVETRMQSPSGRFFLQFKPVFKPDCTAEGNLSFAVWQSWQDEPATHEPARQAALANARQVMSGFALALAK